MKQQHRPRHRVGSAVRGTIAALASAVMIAVGLVAITQTNEAQAANPNDFNPGLIISDSQFYDGGAMTESQIQSFLVARGSALQSFNGSVMSRGHETSSKTGNVICTAFTGGSSLPASTIIYRTQVACGISAKAIIVTLQKEQGLITARTAGQAALDRAMGYACPDTAPCAAYALGFGNQVFMGARQLKIYKADRFAKQPGVHSVPWHPNTACGSSQVNMQNYATAALYNYTPYRPNAAALANYPGTGDSCSSYGNRNFWFLYSDWFGNPTAVDGAFAINEAYAANGGAGGLLGAAVGSLDCPVSRTQCWQEYRNGYIAWTAGSSARVVSGVIAQFYKSLGGPTGSLGYPNSEMATVAENGGGVAQSFQKGLVNAGPAGPFIMTGAIRELHGALGGVAANLGWPVGAQVCGLPGGGCSQQFQNGSIYLLPSGIARAVTDPRIDALYRSLDGPAGSVGYPTSETVFDAANGGGYAQAFEHGLINAGPPGAFLETGIIRTKHSNLGSVAGVLGWPTSAQICAQPGKNCEQDFQGGTLYSDAPDVDWNLSRLFADAHAAAGGAAGALGAKVGSMACAGSASCWQEYDRGYIYWSLSTGTRISAGSIGTAYRGYGGPGGALGAPISDIVQDPSNGGGFAQAFEHALINAGPNGAFAETGAIRVRHSQLGSVAGVLGWPTSEQVCNLPGGGCSQTFQGGAIYAPKVGGVQAITSTAINDFYVSAGGPAGSLGYPTSATARDGSNGGGYAQAFEHGLVNAGPKGAFVETGVIRARHSQLGSVAGSLGWPVAAQVCGLPGGGCSQEFQGGTLYAPATGVAQAVTNDSIKTLYASLGGPGGSLGYPVSETAYERANGGGYAQAFEHGLINAGPKGAFVETGVIRARHSQLGSVAGPLGWPVAAQVCGLPGGGCSQEFQGGTLTSP